VPFVESTTPAQNPSISLTSTPNAVAQNPDAASCQWSHQLVVRETSGFQVQLTSLKQGTIDLTSTLQSLFGTTRLGPWSTLRGNLCLNSAATIGTRNYTLAGASEIGLTVSSAVSVTYSGAPAGAAAVLATSPAALTLPIDGSTQSSLASIALSTGGPADWTASVSGAHGSRSRQHREAAAESSTCRRWVRGFPMAFIRP
jgi:hypothetical protein